MIMGLPRTSIHTSIHTSTHTSGDHGAARTSAVVSAAERRLKAYHEAGHVIVARVAGGAPLKR